MNIGFFNRIPWMPLVLIWLAYALLGWYLSVHHIIWFVGAFVAGVVLAVISKTISWLEALIDFGSQTLVVVLFLSLSIALIETWSLFFSLFLMPLATTLLANLEMRFAGFSQTDRFFVLTILAGLGLAVGETIDAVFFPSVRY
ncbi:MAG: hypothetical protein KME60_24820 [Cyanomargarita calcarea GSE-NOS-MK-12-04C]|jgi:hypothetical protein|uniref:Uncharacterized protein n=1 Tax=Cyanomargarita calcarea GSE-NOS-MK-12-04C TaxID=2839659 RepID=A0A951QT05_9CYAN|nr:hypothetical protein [Cyanomargarita calcarea GSE-NOS-MK-12-04C]